MGKWLPPAGGGYSARSSSKNGTGKGGRTAVTGRFVKQSTVKKNPANTVKTSRTPPKSKGGATRAR